jgi:hypothetical protein
VHDVEELYLDEATHTYWLGKTKFDSVTEILKFLGLSRCYDGISSFYSERGKAVHKAVEFVDKGTLDESSLSDLVRPYVVAYRKFLAESGYRPHAWEVPLYDSNLRFAGTIDKVGYLGDKLGILDIKTSTSIDPAVEDQLCAYRFLWDQHHADGSSQWGYALQLKEDGTYSLCTKYSDCPAEDWRSIMTVYRKKQKRTK